MSGKIAMLFRRLKDIAGTVGQALEGIDDPQRAYFEHLEARIRRLEAQAAGEGRAPDAPA